MSARRHAFCLSSSEIWLPFAAAHKYEIFPGCREQKAHVPFSLQIDRKTLQSFQCKRSRSQPNLLEWCFSCTLQILCHVSKGTLVNGSLIAPMVVKPQGYQPNSCEPLVYHCLFVTMFSIFQILNPYNNMNQNHWLLNVKVFTQELITVEE